jgi:hypothetical protein
MIDDNFTVFMFMLSNYTFWHLFEAGNIAASINKRIADMSPYFSLEISCQAILRLVTIGNNRTAFGWTFKSRIQKFKTFRN